MTRTGEHGAVAVHQEHRRFTKQMRARPTTTLPCQHMGSVRDFTHLWFCEQFEQTHCLGVWCAGLHVWAGEFCTCSAVGRWRSC